MKAVHFGAGNIGRGFIGPLLIESGYELTFIDVDERKIELLNSLAAYPVTIIGEDETTKEVRGYCGLSLYNEEAVIRAIAGADIITTAVGKEALKGAAPLIAKGLSQKLRAARGSSRPVHIIVIACENVNENTAYLKSLIVPHLSAEVAHELGEFVKFPNCAVDRIIPNVSPDTLTHPLAVAVEEYSLFAVDKVELGTTPLAVSGADCVMNIRGVLEQKLFTLNMAHAIIGYYGYLAGHRFVHEALQDGRIQELLSGALSEVQRVLGSRHGINKETQERYAQKVLSRLQNPRLTDEITRVSRQPKRKLHSSDRLVAPARAAFDAGIVPAYLATGIAGALAYDYEGDDQAQELVRDLRQRGIDCVLQETASLLPDDELARLIKSDFLFQSLVGG